jgi:phytoene dehydrogenase-like protein
VNTTPTEALPEKCDAVVIGAGHNGLVAAGYLARAGRKVAVVEAGDRLGGMTTSGAFIPEAPGHIVNPCAVDIISMLHSQIFKDLELRKHGLEIIKPDPSYVYLHPTGETLALWKDPKRTAAEIAKFSPGDAKEFLGFIELLDALVAAVLPVMGLDFARPDIKAVWRSAKAGFKHRKKFSDLVSLLLNSATTAIDERFEHEITKSAMGQIAAGAGPIDREGSGLGFLLLILLSRVGVGRPIGGMQSLTTALVRGLEANNGAVQANAAVAEILHANGKTQGVRLADGRVIEAPSVISSCDPIVTLVDLIEGDIVDRKTRARLEHSSANGAGSGPFKIDMALDAQIATVRHRRDDDVDLRIPTLLIGDYDCVRNAYAQAAKGEVPDDPALWIVAPSAADQTQAPVGQESVYLYDLAEPVAPAGGWDVHRDTAVERILSKTGEYLAPLKEAEIGRLVETPEDLGKRLNVRNGCITHLDMGLLRSGPFRPTVGLGLGKTPLKGLFLGGSATHPGGGVTGLPGRTSAERTLRFLAKQSG